MPLMMKMVDVFGSLRSLFKVQRISEDTMIFRLHYRATVALLLGGCVTLACKSISGSPIHCEASGSVDKIVLETFCWLHTTYSMVHAFNKSLGQAVPYPGVSNSKGAGMHGHASHPLVKQHKYYQWVIFFLLLQVRKRHSIAVVDDINSDNSDWHDNSVEFPLFQTFDYPNDIGR